MRGEKGGSGQSVPSPAGRPCWPERGGVSPPVVGGVPRPEGGPSNGRAGRDEGRMADGWEGRKGAAGRNGRRWDLMEGRRDGMGGDGRGVRALGGRELNWEALGGSLGRWDGMERNCEATGGLGMNYRALKRTGTALRCNKREIRGSREGRARWEGMGWNGSQDREEMRAEREEMAAMQAADSPWRRQRGQRREPRRGARRDAGGERTWGIVGCSAPHWGRHFMAGREP